MSGAAAHDPGETGGLELLLGCDVVVASSEARFGLPEVQRGLFAAGGGTFIGQRIPLAVALEIALTGDLFDAERIAANGPLAEAASKELVRLGASDAGRARQRLDEWREVVFSSDDAREGARAFVEKRPPAWSGR